MLTHLLIRNLAVVDEVEVEPGAGLTVLTGETGAGKSILVDALALALGERADSDAVRPGARRAEIAAEFAIAQDSAAAVWLREHDLDDAVDNDAGVCLIRRVVTPEGRSRGYINGNPAPMQTLRLLGERLVDICGQQAHQSLGRADTQRSILDQHGNNLALLAELRDAHTAWQEHRSEHGRLAAAKADQEARLELLQFQVEELRALAPQPGEYAELEAAHRRAAHASRLLSEAGAALSTLYDGSDELPSATDLVGSVRTTLETLRELDDTLSAPARLLADAEIQLTEAADELRNYLNVDQDSALSLDDLDARLTAMHDLARKHHVDPDALVELAERLERELHEIEHADETLDELKAHMDAAAEKHRALCKKLTTRRRKAARALEQRVVENIRQLGMPEGSFTIELPPLDEPSAQGAERVEFRVALNPGMRPGPLTKVASGGELSRVSLAIQVAASTQSNTPTLIFDEVDAGVGGGTADIVGAQLRGLADTSQVLCVTHLPQVASKGHHHFRVSKLSDGKNTRTRVTPLTHEERVEELARMLGGVKITQRTREHAEEMLDSAAQPQKTG